MYEWGTKQNLEEVGAEAMIDGSFKIEKVKIVAINSK